MDFTAARIHLYRLRPEGVWEVAESFVFGRASASQAASDPVGAADSGEPAAPALPG